MHCWKHVFPLRERVHQVPDAVRSGFCVASWRKGKSKPALEKPLMSCEQLLQRENKEAVKVTTSPLREHLQLLLQSSPEWRALLIGARWSPDGGWKLNHKNAKSNRWKKNHTFLSWREIENSSVFILSASHLHPLLTRPNTLGYACVCLMCALISVKCDIVAC